MFSRGKMYYGDDNEAELLRLLKRLDTGAYFEVVYRYHKQLTLALSEIFTLKIGKDLPLIDYVDCLLEANIRAHASSSTTFMLLWNYRSTITADSLYEAIFEMLEIELFGVDASDKPEYDLWWKNKILTYFLLQHRQIKCSMVLRRYLLIWITEEQQINSQLFTLKFFEHKSISKIRKELQMSTAEIEAQIQVIYAKFEQYLPKIVNRVL